MNTSALHIVTYERKYRDAVLSLAFYARNIHTHMDWYRTGRWLDSRQHLVKLAFDERGMLCGVLGVSLPVHGAAWLRMVALSDHVNAADVIQHLWLAIQPPAQAQGVTLVGALLMNKWLAAHLPALGFVYQEDVVTLLLPHIDLPDPPAHDLHIRNAYIEDVRAIVAVDHAAFVPPWQLSRPDTRQALRQVASCTLAEHQGTVIGYQMSTRHLASGHLARLAVAPASQGKRVGAALLYHLLDRMRRRGVRTMTVNTQQSNHRSQRLYTRFGFVHNGYDLPIWLADIAD